ncbi:hypothetical protein K490DRAFT_44621 [Saccharata proteae CBS 121410]|uniref:HIT-type domain-containing protein n=1 Tax=Saccharata proteae CBS 121410 TaxID=1314787 RepID=A0A9P4LVR5_9PEZI|nr:hypothetical protein K490DRAFT_44621 [Saccharata proteae CBS 121410]
MPSIEVLPNTGAAAAPAPGWAYVPDTGYDPSKAPINPAARKRTARNPNAQTASTTTARQETQLLRRIADLDRDNTKDIPVPGESKKRREGQKMTPNVRRILQSGRNFGHWLAEEEAREQLGQQGQRPIRGYAIQAVPDSPATPSTPAPMPKAAIPTPMQGTPAHNEPPSIPDDAMDLDAPMEEDPLLQTNITKTVPSGVIEELLSAPPLSYSAARVAPPPNDGPPKRLFCELCGYWGRYKCQQCGERICGVECKNTHMEMRCLRM